MTKKKKVSNYEDIKKNPYYQAFEIKQVGKRPKILRVNQNNAIFSFFLFMYTLYYSVSNNDGALTGMFGGILLTWYFAVSERTLFLKNKLSRFLISGAIAAFYTFNVCGVFGIHYPILFDLLKDNVVFCFGLPPLMMIVSAFLPLKIKVRFYSGNSLGAVGLVIFAMLQNLIQHHDLFIYSYERMQTALSYSWIAFVAGIIAIFVSKFDVKYYDEYLSWCSRQVDTSPRRQNYYGNEYESESPSSGSSSVGHSSSSYERERPSDYGSPWTSDEMRGAWDRGEYTDEAHFQHDHVWTGGDGSK